MNQKKIIYIMISLVIILYGWIFIIKNYKNFLIRALYATWNYSKAIEYFPNNQTGYYDKANLYYKIKDYKNAINFYQKALSTWASLLNYYVYHNLWNTYYRVGEKSNNFFEKIKNWQLAAESYTNAIKIWKKINLDQKDLEETKKNLDFVLNKLKELEKQNHLLKNNQQENNNKKSFWNEAKKQANEEKTKQWNKTNKSNQQWKNNNSQNWNKKDQNNWQNKNTSRNWKEQTKTSNSEQNDQTFSQVNQKKWSSKKDSSSSVDQALQQYEKQLMQQQKQLMQQYWKVYQEPQNNPFDDSFFDDIQDPFFEDLPFWQKNDIKDW